MGEQRDAKMLDDVRKVNGLLGREVGKYHVGEELGRGAFGCVYRATDMDIDREVAIKFLMPQHGNEYAEHQLARFRREAKLVSKLHGPHIVTLHEFGEHEGVFYLAFEYIQGHDLEAAIEEAAGPMQPLRVANILRQALEGLREAHHYGIVHRDIKPANIMLFEHIGAKDRVKLMDFGIGRSDATDEASTALTADGSMLGTPLYMSPEHVRPDEYGLDHRADIYSLGMVGLEMLTGRTGLEGKSRINVYATIITTPSLALEATDAIPAGLCRIINRMLAKVPDERYQSTAQVIEDLDRLQPGPVNPPGMLYQSEEGPRPAELDEAIAKADATITHDPELDAMIAATQGPDKQRMMIIAAIVGLLILGAIGLGVILNSTGNQPPADQVAAEVKKPEPPKVADRAPEAPPKEEVKTPEPAATPPVAPAEPDMAPAVAEKAPEPEKVEEEPKKEAKKKRRGKGRRTVKKTPPKADPKPTPAKAPVKEVKPKVTEAPTPTPVKPTPAATGINLDEMTP